MSWAPAEGLDYRRALHIFRLRRDTVPEVLCRRVLQLVGTGITYPSLMRSQRETLLTWCTILGSRGPEWDDEWELTVVDSVVRDASRAAAGDLVMIVGVDRASALARELLPAAKDRAPVAVLSALGYRALAKLVRTVDAGEDAAADQDSWLWDEDRYSEMEYKVAGSGTDAPAEWEVQAGEGNDAPR